MVIVSKFDGHCKVCDGRTYRGDRVVWIKGQKGVSHPACHVGAMPQRVVQVAAPVAELVEDPSEAEKLVKVDNRVDVVDPSNGEVARVEPEVLKNPRDPKELCSFLTSLSDEQLEALKAIVEGEQARRGETQKEAA